MTRTRVIAALLMAPLAMLAILFLPTPWMAALAAVVFLAGLWDWLKLAEVDDSLHRTILLLPNLLHMALTGWAAPGSFVLLQSVAVAREGERQTGHAGGSTFSSRVRQHQQNKNK